MNWYTGHVPANQLAKSKGDNRTQHGPEQPHRLRTKVFFGRLSAVIPAFAVLLLWEFLTHHQVISAYLLPTPGDVVRSLRLSWADHSLSDALLTTLNESLAGFALGAFLAFPLGYAIAHSRLLAWLIEPYIAKSQALPAVALAPLLVLWLGYGTQPIVLLCALIVFFPITIATVLGLRNVDREILDAAAVDGADRWISLWRIKVPLALPSILAGVRTGLTYSITGAVVGEFVVNAQGLGGLIMIARGTLDTPLVFSTLLVLVILATLFYGTGRVLERVLISTEAE